jgi:transcriptional regulator
MEISGRLLHGEFMYLPKRFENSDWARSLSLMQKYPLATVISQTDEGPFVSHLPLVVEVSEDEITLLGHFARANPHWKAICKQPVYVIFNGPQAYITAKWYAENDVPTWNYAVVHLKGSCSLIEDSAGIQKCLKVLSDFAEKGSADPWEFWIPEDLAAPGVLEKAIVGFSIRVESIQSKFKLSQNRLEADRAGVIRGLEGRKDDASRAILELMKQAL